MKKVMLLLFVIFTILLISCDTTEVTSSYSVTYKAQNCDGGNYVMPRTGLNRSFSGSSYTRTFTGVASGVTLSLTAYGTNDISAFGTRASILVDGKEVASNRDIGGRTVSVNYTL